MSENRNSRIKKALKEGKVSQEKLGAALGITSQAVNERLNKDQDIDSIEFVETVSRLTGFTVNWILKGMGNMMLSDPIKFIQEEPIHIPEVNEPELAITRKIKDFLSGKTIRPVTVVVNQHGRELMSYVPVKAQAGYMRGYGDPHFLEKLPAFSLPILKDGAYRMFEVDGDSMLQLGGGGLHDGDIVVAQYLEDIFTVRDNRVYVVISTEGVCVKRCLNRLKDKENPVLICNSDNKNGQHSAIVLRAHEILEVWELKAFISRQLSFSTDLWQVINDLQVQQSLLKEKVDHLENKQLMP